MTAISKIHQFFVIAEAQASYDRKARLNGDIPKPTIYECEIGLSEDAKSLKFKYSHGAERNVPLKYVVRIDLVAPEGQDSASESLHLWVAATPSGDYGDLVNIVTFKMPRLLAVELRRDLVDAHSAVLLEAGL